MKKRLLCLTLSVLMAFSVILTGCAKKKTDAVETGEDGNPKTTSTIKPMTIVLTGITDEATTPEAIALVEKEINQITKAKFKTQIVLDFYTADEYDAVIDQKVVDIKDQIAKEEADELAAKEAAKKAKEEAKASGKKPETTKKEEETTEEPEETVLNDSGRAELKYPELKGTQLDIFMVRGLDSLLKYNKEELLSTLDEELNLGAKKLKDYIHPIFLDAGKIEGKTVAIPNNRPIGEYKYLLLNKELVDKYSYDADKLTTLADCEEFLADVAKNETGIIPLLNTADPLIETLTSGTSILGAYVPNTATYGANNPPKNLFGVKQFADHLVLMDTYKKAGYLPASTPADDAKYAVAVMPGTASSPEQWEENYYVNVYEKPKATNDIVYDSMFAISTYTKDVSRCMQILTWLNTNAEFRNLFQYGVEGVNYELSEEGRVVRKTNDYMMDIYTTGNTFIAYPEEGMDANIWEEAKKANLEASVSPYLGFAYETPETASTLEKLQTLSDESFAKLDAYTGDDLKTFLSDLAKEIDATDVMKSIMDKEGENSITTLYTTYQASAAPPAPAADPAAAPAA